MFNPSGELIAKYSKVSMIEELCNPVKSISTEIKQQKGFVYEWVSLIITDSVIVWVHLWIVN